MLRFGSKLLDELAGSVAERLDLFVREARDESHRAAWVVGTLRDDGREDRASGLVGILERDSHGVLPLAVLLVDYERCRLLCGWPVRW